MKQLITIILLSILASVSFQGTSFAQQTPANTKCNEKSGLQWQMNPEPDVHHYAVYAANSAGIATANPPVQVLMTVDHDPSKAVIDSTGKKVFKSTLQSTLSEGDKWFAVKAVDAAGNDSNHSNEVGCDYDVSPDAPLLQLIFTK